MIRAIICGAASDEGCELLRILLNHPDIHLANAYAPELAGTPVTDHVNGLTGDTDLVFSGSCNMAEGDVIFLADNTPAPFDLDAPGSEGLRVIDLTGTHAGHEGYVDGVCELNRKPLVRGARRAALPDPVTILAVTALLPLAASSLLNDTLTLTVTDTGRTHTHATDVTRLLRTLQPDYEGFPAFGKKTGTGFLDMHDRERFMQITATIRAGISAGHAERLYNEYFDDHNFVFVIDRDAIAADVVNTSKILLRITDSDDGTLTVTATFDPVIKGSAGAAVHCMNLLFGLHERTGLQLKALA